MLVSRVSIYFRMFYLGNFRKKDWHQNPMSIITKIIQFSSTVYEPLVMDENNGPWFPDKKKSFELDTHIRSQSAAKLQKYQVNEIKVGFGSQLNQH